MVIGYKSGGNSGRQPQVRYHCDRVSSRGFCNIILIPVFVEAKRTTKAMYSHEKSLTWQELFDLAVMDGMPEDDIIAMGYRVAG